ncbi:alpha/beta hydrolase family protein [Actinoplanes awajinensis]|uniref:Peptidase S9 prolyl oligopeptidase catalytic domain-containing protein n=1 Tax=Actinoplanes awajinensis subsp. mycoplanecinus TaxID=135947 RepID=A0A0X3UPK1_9ACTN|nr:hypothetical protein [Actinoplanes awajinensis]KUL34509.1 hypothetical protein ADL15_15640 [Actinoplanes awajinensis subsp. mycoplanecinus]
MHDAAPPMLFLHGDKDSSTVLEDARELAGRLRKGRRLKKGTSCVFYAAVDKNGNQSEAKVKKQKLTRWPHR